MVDASVAVKWLVSEHLSAESEKLLVTGVTLLAPELMFAEAANALWAMRQRGDIDRPQLAAAVDLLRDAPVATPVPMRLAGHTGAAPGRDGRHEIP